MIGMESLFDLILFVIIVLIPLLANIFSSRKMEDQKDQLSRPTESDDEARVYRVKANEERKPLQQNRRPKNKNANSSLKKKKKPSAVPNRNAGKQAETQGQSENKSVSRIKGLTQSNGLAHSEMASNQIKDQARIEDKKIPQLSEEAKLAIVESDLFKSKKIAEENLAKLSQGVASKKELKRRNKLRQMIVAKEILDKPLAYRKR